MKSYGRAPTFLMLTGYEQVRSIVAEIAGDHEAAAQGRAGAARDRRVLGPGPGHAAGGSCRGCAAARAGQERGCCVADVEAKDEGKKGCGCAD